MSDIPPVAADPASPPSDPLAAPVVADTTTAPEAVLDPATQALLDQLAPFFATIAQTAITEAIKATPVPTARMATVTAIDLTTGTLTVTADGDTATSVCENMTELPIVGDRVLVVNFPPAASFAIGIKGGLGLQPGMVVGYAGIITSATGGPSASGPPRGCLWLYGQVVAQASYPGLYAVVGTTYNTGGEAATDFRLPDFRGRIPVGLDNMGGSDAGRLSSANTLGTTGGAESHTIGTGNLPSHTHGYTPSGSVSISSVTGSVSVSDPGHGHSVNDPSHSHGDAFTGNIGNNGGAAGNFAGSDYDYRTSYDTTGISVNGSGTGISASLSGGSGSGSFSGFGSSTDGGPGSSTGINHMPPFITVHWIVKA